MRARAAPAGFRNTPQIFRKAVAARNYVRKRNGLQSGVSAFAWLSRPAVFFGFTYIANGKTFEGTAFRPKAEGASLEQGPMRGKPGGIGFGRSRIAIAKKQGRAFGIESSVVCYDGFKRDMRPGVGKGGGIPQIETGDVYSPVGTGKKVLHGRTRDGPVSERPRGSQVQHRKEITL